MIQNLKEKQKVYAWNKNEKISTAIILSILAHKILIQFTDTNFVEIVSPNDVYATPKEAYAAREGKISNE